MTETEWKREEKKSKVKRGGDGRDKNVTEEKEQMGNRERKIEGAGNTERKNG